MFLGHIAVGFASKRAALGTSLGWLMTAPVLLDLLWPLFLLAGIERVRLVPGGAPFAVLDFESYPWSHSLLSTLVWAASFALLARAFRVDVRGAWVVAGGVVTHWVLDWISHRPDMPLAPGGGPRLGLGLWNSVPATLTIECAMFAAGLGLYLAATRARGWAGHVSLWAFVALVVFAYFASAFGPPPPSVQVLGTSGLVTWLFVPWAFWIDRSRALRAAPA